MWMHTSVGVEHIRFYVNFYCIIMSLCFHRNYVVVCIWRVGMSKMYMLRIWVEGFNKLHDGLRYVGVYEFINDPHYCGWFGDTISILK